MKRHIFSRRRTHREHESRTLPGEGRSFLFETVAPGAVVGLVGGALMVLLYGAFSTAGGLGFFALPRMIAGMFWRDLHTLQMPWEAVLVGLFIHFQVAMAVGITWSLLFPRNPYSQVAVLPLSIFFALVSYVVLYFFLAEFVSPPMRRELNTQVWMWLHVVFGLVLALVPVLRSTRWVARHKQREVATHRPLPVS